MPSVNLPRIAKKSRVINTSESALARKYGFDEATSKAVTEALDNNARFVHSFCTMALHIKGLGFAKDEISELVQLLGENALDLGNWRAVQTIKSHTSSIEVACYAYRAGLTPDDVKSMSPQQLSLENLKIMATIKNL